MRSRWNDAEARGLERLDLLVYASRLIGAETSLVVWGGGNTSIKTVERDHRGREVPVLRVKGSGSDLKSVQRKDFPGVRMDDILALLERDDMGDQEMVSYLAHGLVDAGGTRPSIETLLHGFLSAHAVIHTHADAIVSLTNNDRHRAVVAEVYGKDVITLPYRRPGFRISRDVADALRQHPDAKAVVLERHGTITWGAAFREAYDATIERAVERFVAEYTRYFDDNRFEGAVLADPLPRVVLVPGLGMFTAGRDRRTTGIVSDIYHHTIDVIGGASAFGEYVSLSAKDAFDVEYWPLELYKLTLAPPEKELARRIALVTGGASGIGRAVARRLAAEGAHVVVADLFFFFKQKTAYEIVATVGAGRALGLGMDVSREDSVSAGVEETVLAYGGLDILVSNAGVAHSCPVERLSLADWERSFAVNATGHFLVAREALK